MMKATKFFFIVIIISLLMSFFRLGSVKLFDVDEAVFAQATKEMIGNNNWLTPTYNGVNRYDKPVLFYWLMAASYQVFGINETGARFPSAMAACVLALSIFFFSRHFRDDTYALYTVITFVLSLYFLVYSHSAVTDMTLSLFISLSLFSFYLARERDGRSLYLYGFYLFSALAFLTKGLIGIAFPFGIAVTFMFMTERWQGVRRVFSLKATMLFLAVAAPWYIAQLVVNGREFVDLFFIKHHFKRYLDVISGHRGPFYYYIPVFMAGLFPWSMFFPLGIRNALKTKDSFSIFALVWFTFIFIFFSFSTTKLPNYILPAVPAAVMLVSSGMVQHSKKWWRYSNAALAVMSFMIGIAFLISRPYFFKYGIHDINWIFYLSLITILMGVLFSYAAYAHKSYWGAASVLVMAFVFVLSIYVLPLASDYLQGTLYRYSLYAKSKLQGDQKIIAYGINKPSIVFYSGHKIISTGKKAEVKEVLDADKQLCIAVTKIKKVDELKELGFNLVENDETYALLERKE
jgi:4-amino-4-deoxy-L-arabinose transferase-like glycosyltransferase